MRPSTAQDYRPDIDGLRALAVLPVVLFHAGFTAVPGGFVGVDVFFVISGYLITRILWREARQEKFSIARFYERRIRRIFPALFAVLLVTSVAGLVLLVPAELKALGKSILATALFSSNMLFFRQAGYFDISAVTKPLLHTWSLSVEEQFYLFFPLLIWIVRRWNRRLVLAVMAGFAVLSFALNLVLIYKWPNAAFFLLPPRAWELLAGSVLALLPASLWRPRRAMAATGILLILATVFLLPEALASSGAAVAVPVLGAVLVIWGGEGSAAGRALASAPLRFVGLISYSLYLWHWPLLVYARLLYGANLPAVVALVCVLLSIFLAWLSYRWIEQPFRRRRQTRSNWVVFAWGGGAAVTACAVAMLFLTGLPSRLPPAALKLASYGTRPEFPVPGCWIPEGPNPDVAKCLIGHRAQKVVLWGDSHARQYIPALAEAADQRGFELRVVGRAGCVAVLDATPVRPRMRERECPSFNAAALVALERDPAVGTVLLGGRWTRFVLPETDDESQRLASPEMPRGEGTIGLLTTSLDRVIARLQKAGKRVILIASVPEVRSPLPNCLARSLWLGINMQLCDHQTESLPGSSMDQLLTALVARHPGAVMLRPADVLCGNGQCRRTVEGNPVLWDRNHLTPDAARWVVAKGKWKDAL